MLLEDAILQTGFKICACKISNGEQMRHIYKMFAAMLYCFH